MEEDLGGGTAGYYGYTKSFTNINIPTNWKGSGLGEWSGELTSDAYGYAVNEIITDTTKQNLVIGNAGGYYYWIASRDCYVKSNASWGVAAVNEDRVSSGYFLCNSSDTEQEHTECLRPVVSIPSNVTINQLAKLTTAPSETWADPLNKAGR